MNPRRIFTGSLIALVAMAITATVQPAAAQGINSSDVVKGSLLTELKQRQLIKVGFSTFVPWAMRDKKGDMIGYEIDVANKLGKDSGWQTELVPMAWDGLIPALLSGKIDVIIGGMNANVKRSQTVAFSIPYEHGSSNLTANRKVAGGRTKMEDFNTPDTIFAQRRGTTPIKFIQTFLPKAKILQFDDESTVKQELLSGRAHVVWQTYMLGKWWTEDFPDALYIPMPGQKLVPSDSGIATRQGDQVFLNYLNNWIRENTISDYLPTRYEYWFGGRPWKHLVPEKK